MYSISVIPKFLHLSQLTITGNRAQLALAGQSLGLGWSTQTGQSSPWGCPARDENWLQLLQMVSVLETRGGFTYLSRGSILDILEEYYCTLVQKYYNLKVRRRTLISPFLFLIKAYRRNNIAIMFIIALEAYPIPIYTS